MAGNKKQTASTSTSKQPAKKKPFASIQSTAKAINDRKNMNKKVMEELDL